MHPFIFLASIPSLIFIILQKMHKLLLTLMILNNTIKAQME